MSQEAYNPEQVVVARHLEIDQVINCETGEFLAARDVLTISEEQFAQLRVRIHAARCTGRPLFVCYYCTEPIYPAQEVIPINRGAHFRHFCGDGDCKARTRDSLSTREKLALQYDGAKESPEHHEMKEWLEQSLRADPNFSGIETEKRWKSVDGQRWRKPDVCAEFKGQKIAFEIQLSTTYVEVIVERAEFYRSEGAVIVWVFREFSRDHRQAAINDIFHNNNRNAFVVSTETVQQSIAGNRLVLRCIWPEPDASADCLDEKWQSKMVGFDELTLESQKQRAWFFDCEKSRAAFEAQLTQRRAAEVRDLLREFVASKDKLQWENRLKLWNDAKSRAAEARVDIPDAEHMGSLDKLLAYIFSAEAGVPVGFGFRKLVEIAFNADQYHRDLMKPLGWALGHFGRLKQLDNESAKWPARRDEIRGAMKSGDERYKQDESGYAVIAFVFPELRDKLTKRFRADVT